MQSLLSKCFAVVLVCIALTSVSEAQSFSEDLLLIGNAEIKNEQKDQEAPQMTFFQKVNPLRILYSGSLGFYQKNISVQIAANCVFAKTCSHFSKDLTNEFGILGGMILSIDRLSRCNRISILETSPLNFNEKGKIKESVNDYRF